MKSLATWSLFALLGFAQVPAWATITISTFGGVTSFRQDANTIEAIAGMSGANRCASTTGLCNSCLTCNTAATPGAAGSCGSVQCCTCNTAAVTNNTIFSITFSSNSITTGVPKLNIGTAEKVSTSGTGSGGQFVFTQTWGEICNLLSEGTAANCDTMGPITSKTVTLSIPGTTADSGTFTLKLYNQTTAVAGAGVAGSVMYFSVFPGDEKVYVDDVEGEGSFPQSSAGLIKYVRFFISSVSLEDAYTNSNYSPADMAVDADGNVEQVIDGLENDIPFHFRAASVDEAGNVFNVMDDTLLASATSETGVVSTCTTNATGGGGAACKFQATPSRVLGLLTEDMNCFVATAAYGSSMDPHIQTFRDFRFKVLLPSKVGQKLNYLYYEYGPYAARFIGEHEWARTLSRTALWPVWGLSALSVKLQLNLWQSMVLFTSCFLTLLLTPISLVSFLRSK